MVDLIRTNGFSPFAMLRGDMDRAFEDLLWGFPMAQRPREFPAVNLWEEGERLFAEFELPGMSMQDLQLELTGNELSLRGERRTEAGDGQTYHRRERGTGRFARVLRLPFEVDARGVVATLEHGVLLVELPKSEAARPRRIEVKSREQ